MRFSRSFVPSLLLLGAGAATAASSWNFDEAVISVAGKGGATSGFKDKYVGVVAAWGAAYREDGC